MVGPSLVCGINVCFVQLQDMHHMEENVHQSNLQLVSFLFFFSFFFFWFYSRARFLIASKQASQLKWRAVEI